MYHVTLPAVLLGIAGLRSRQRADVRCRHQRLRNRPADAEYPYLILDATFEKARKTAA